MKLKIDDSKLYFWFIIITLSLGIICGGIGYYSIYKIEPKVQALLDEGEIMFSDLNKSENKDATLTEISNKYTAAYKMLRKPQIFAMFENFDRHDSSVKNIIRNYDAAVKDGKKITPRDRVYLDVLFKRREMGSGLAKNTMFFFFLLSLTGMCFLAYEKYQLKKN